ncbi:MAG: hypothetical protein IJU98_07740 [Synergistaceae bacterium]|nr:hypothetical protein [Synergistaceae bacterium]
MKLSRSGIDDMLTSPWALWLISIAMAVTLWVYVTGIEEGGILTRRFSCPLDYRSVDPQAILRGRVSEVEIEVEGLEQDILRLNYDKVVAFVDAQNLTPGRRYTQNVNIALPPGIELVSCTPSQVVMDLVRQVSRLMTVEVALPAKIPEGQYLEGVEVIPREVGVRGAEGDVAKVGALRVTPTLEELQSGKDLLLPVKFAQSEPFDGSVVLEPSQVRFKGALVRGLPRKRVPVNARLSGTLNGDYEIRSVVTDPSEVQVEGVSERLAQVESVETEMIDISNLTADQTLVVPLRSPDITGVALSNVSSVRVFLQLGEVKAGKRLVNVPVEIRGSKGERWMCDPASVTVTIEGAPSRIESVTAEDIGLNAWVDISNIFVSPVTLPVRTEMKSEGFGVSKIEPATVTVSALGGLDPGSGKW